MKFILLSFLLPYARAAIGDLLRFAPSPGLKTCGSSQILHLTYLATRLREGRGQVGLLDVLKKHEGLIGTLLGYGRENAWLFHRRDLGESIHLSRFVDLQGKAASWLGFFGKQQIDVSEKNLFLPTFIVDANSEETKQLKKNYLAIRKKILNVYSGKDFLVTTLALLMDPSPNICEMEILN
jgi:hypothetical protein